MDSTDQPGGDRSGWRLLWAAYAGLLGVGIPWYWPEGNTMRLLGLPAWVVTSILASVAVSVLTAAVFLRPWPEEIGPEETQPPGEEETE